MLPLFSLLFFVLTLLPGLFYKSERTASLLMLSALSGVIGGTICFLHGALTYVGIHYDHYMPGLPDGAPLPSAIPYLLTAILGVAMVLGGSVIFLMPAWIGPWMTWRDRRAARRARQT